MYVLKRLFARDTATANDGMGGPGMLNFAGVAAETKYDGTARVDNFSTEDFDLVMGVNCRGVWLCCKVCYLIVLLGQGEA